MCITDDSKELGKMKKQLTLMERVAVREFASTHAGYFASDDFDKDLCKELLNVLGSVFITLLKHDMCQGVTAQHRSVLDVVQKAFMMPDEEVNDYFASLGDMKATKSLNECLYYVAGWHAHTIKKAGDRRREGVREFMATVYSNILIEKEKAGMTKMPIQKVERVELFGH